MEKLGLVPVLFLVTRGVINYANYQVACHSCFPEKAHQPWDLLPHILSDPLVISPN